MIVISLCAKVAIHPVPCVPPDSPTSAFTSPWCPLVELIVIVVPDQISTPPVEFAGLPGRFGALHRFCGGTMCPGPVDSTSPKIVTSQPCRCTRSAPGSPPRPATTPVPPTTPPQHTPIPIGPPCPPQPRPPPHPTPACT